MRCKYCGGEINLSVGRCVSCGRGVDATSDIRILHDLGSIAEQYGLDPDQEKYNNSPAAQDSSQPLEQRTSAGPMPLGINDAKKPGIELSTYYELLGSGGPEESDQPDDPAVVLERLDADTGDDPRSEWLFGRFGSLLDKLDQLTRPLTERMRSWFDAKMPQMKRAKSNSKLERLMLVGITAAIAVVILLLCSFIISSIPASLSGEWQVSADDAAQLFTVEFSRGEITALVYDDAGEAHVYKRGTYSTSRSNGRDLLTIVYEDGSLSHLYYTITGRTGEFVNVDTGRSDQYRRIG